MVKHLFVYGTLKQGERNHFRLIRFQPVYIGRATTSGRLYHLIRENYPALVSGEEPVRGELYELRDCAGTLAALDRLENFRQEDPPDSEYLRKIVKVSGPDKTERKAYAYVYNIKNLAHFTENSVYLSERYWGSIQVHAGRVVQSETSGRDDTVFSQRTGG